MSYTVCITGATGGIGLEFAKQYAQMGSSLILIGRDAAKLEHARESITALVSESKITLIQTDLSVITEVTELMNQLQTFQIDVFINNAGFGDTGEFAKRDLSKFQQMLTVNVETLTYLSHCVANIMKKQKTGTILNVASTAAFQPGPYMAVYYATKSYVLSFSLALHQELKSYGVFVSTLCPGPVTTGFQSEAEMGNSKLLTYVKPKQVDEVVTYAIESLTRRKKVIIPGFMNKIQVSISKITPYFLSLPLVAYLQKN